MGVPRPGQCTKVSTLAWPAPYLEANHGAQETLLTIYPDLSHVKVNRLKLVPV